jgi:hopanoid-associated phosphorylase
MPSDPTAFPEACWGEGVGSEARIGVVVGMRSEAALLPDGLAVGIAAGRWAKAEALAHAMVEDGIQALISIGIAGGLDPSLAPGDVVVGSGVQTAHATYEANSVWKCRLLSAIPLSRAGIIHGLDRAATTPAEKHRLAQGGAMAVDMESGAVAKVAAAAGVPFAVLRVIADPADRALPPSALLGLDVHGDAAAWPVIKSLATRPWDLPGLIRVAVDSQKALTALRDALQIVGPTLGL